MHRVEDVVAKYPKEQRTLAATAVLHEIQRRMRRATMTSSSVKVCPVCNEAKTHDQYNRDASSVDGIDWRCKGCVSAANKKK